MIEKQDILNLISSNSKRYASIVYIDSNVTFQKEGKDTAFRQFIHWVLFTVCVA